MEGGRLKFLFLRILVLRGLLLPIVYFLVAWAFEMCETIVSPDLDGRILALVEEVVGFPLHNDGLVFLFDFRHLLPLAVGDFAPTVHHAFSFVARLDDVAQILVLFYDRGNGDEASCFRVFRFLGIRLLR